MSQTFVSILRLLLIVLSFSGYGIFLYYQFNIKEELLPSVIFSGVIVSLYIAGILNLLSVISYILYFGGFALILYSMIKYKSKIKSCYKIISFGTLFFILLCGYFIILLRGARLYAYDDYSHWGVIVKELQLFDRLPNFSSPVVAFRTYPPASALFVYYVTKFIGCGENKMLMAQMFLTSAYACSIFAFVPRKKEGISSALIASFSVLLLIGLFPQGVSTLLVDTVLPLAGVANTAVIIYYKKQIKTASILSFFLITTTILIKNSGLFFAFINSGLLLYYSIKQYRKEKKESKPSHQIIIFAVLSILLACFMLTLWKQHVKLVFPEDATIGHHSMSIDNYKKNYHEKPQEQFNEISKNFIKNATNSKTRANRVMITYSISITLLYFIMRFGFKKRMSMSIRILLLGDICYVLYIIGIYLMHLFSMPPNEASSFISFNRYAISSVIYFVGLFTIAVLYDIEEQLLSSLINRIFYNICILGILLYSIKFCGIKKILTKIPDYYTTSIYRYDKAMEEIEINRNHSYLLYRPSSAKDCNFGRNVTRYKLFTMNFEIITEITDEKEFEEKIKQYDHFVVIEQDEIVNKYLSLQK